METWDEINQILNRVNVWIWSERLLLQMAESNYTNRSMSQPTKGNFIWIRSPCLSSHVNENTPALYTRGGGIVTKSIFPNPRRGNSIIFSIDGTYKVWDNSDKIYSWPPPPPLLSLPTTISKSPLTSSNPSGKKSKPPSLWNQFPVVSGCMECSN